MSGEGEVSIRISAKNLTKEAFDKAKADVEGLGYSVKNSFDGARKSTEDAGTSFGKLVGSYVTGQAIWDTTKRAFREMVQFVKESIQAYSEQEAALSKMTVALKAQGTYTPALVSQYAALGSEFQRTTIYGDELVEEVMALLVQVGNVMPSDMKGALESVTNLASGLGVDLNTAAMLVGKAFAGETGTLTRYGIVIDETKLKTDGARAVLEAINAQFGGQAAAAAKTYAGQVAQLGNTWGDVKEELGKVLIEMLLPMLPALKATAESMQGLGKVVEWGRIGFDALLYAGLSTLKFLVDAEIRMLSLTNAFGINNAKIAELRAASDGYAASIQGVVAGETKAAPAVETTTGTIRQSTAAMEQAKKAADEHAKALKKLAEETEKFQSATAAATTKMFGGFRDTLADIIQPMQAVVGNGEEIRAELELLDSFTWDGFEKNIAELPEIVRGAGDEVRDAWVETMSFGEELGKDVGTSIVSALQGGGKIAESVAGTVGKKLGEKFVKDFGGDITKKLGDTLGGALNAMLPGLGALMGPLLSGIKKLFSGPSKEELAGRDLVATMEEELAGMANAVQRAEAGNEAWKLTVIVLRDAYKELGYTEQQAMADAERLWKSSKDGGEDAQAVVDELKKRLADAGQVAKDTATDVAGAVDSHADALTGLLAQKQTELTDLMKEQQSLQSSINAEAEEEVMGVIEREQRAKLEQVEAAIDANQQEQESIKSIQDALANIPWDQFQADIRETFAQIPRQLEIELRGIWNLPSMPDVSVGGSASGGMFARPTLRVIAENKPEIVGEPGELAQAFMSALREYGGSAPASGGAGVNVYVAVDPRSGSVRPLGESERAQIQNWMNTGGVQVPARAIGRGRG